MAPGVHFLQETEESQPCSGSWYYPSASWGGTGQHTSALPSRHWDVPASPVLRKTRGIIPNRWPHLRPRRRSSGWPAHSHFGWACKAEIPGPRWKVDQGAIADLLQKIGAANLQTIGTFSFTLCISWLYGKCLGITKVLQELRIISQILLRQVPLQWNLQYDKSNFHVLVNGPLISNTIQYENSDHSLLWDSSLLWVLGQLMVHPARCVTHTSAIFYHSPVFDPYYSCLPIWKKKSSRSGLVLPRGGACVDMTPARSLLVPAPNDSCLSTTGVVPGTKRLCQEDSGPLLKGAHRLAGRDRQVSCHRS